MDHASASTAGTEGLEFLWLEITEKCNLNCIHCYADSSPEKPLYGRMATENWMDVISDARKLGCASLQFIGGEPTIHPALPNLIDHARSSGFEFIEVYTNGTRLTPTLKDTFIRNRVALAFSVYASEDDIHDRVTTRPGSFSKTINTIKWAVASGIKVRVGVIEMAENQGSAESARKMLNDMGVADVGIDRIRGVGRGSMEVKGRDVEQELCGQCWRGKLCVTASGDAYPCVFSRSCHVGSIAEGLETVVNGDVLQAFRRKLQQQDYVHRAEACEPFSPPVCQPKRPICTPDLSKKADCEPFSPPVCKPDRPICSPDLPCSPDNACKPNTPCNPDCVPSACTPQIA